MAIEKKSLTGKKAVSKRSATKKAQPAAKLQTAVTPLMTASRGKLP